METPNTIPQSFEPVRMPMGSVTEAFELGSDDEALPTTLQPSMRLVNGEIVYGEVDPAPTPKADLGATMPLTGHLANTYGHPSAPQTAASQNTGPQNVGRTSAPGFADRPSASGNWMASQYEAPPQSQAALSQSQPWVAQSAQQYVGSNASMSGSMVASAYDPSASIAYNPSASVQIVQVPQTSTAMKFLIAIATIALVFALFAVFMELRRNFIHGGEHAAAGQHGNTGTQSPPSDQPGPINNGASNSLGPIATDAPIATTPPVYYPLSAATTTAPDPTPSATATDATASAAAAKKQKSAPPPPPPVSKPQRITPKQIPANCATPFTLDSNGIKVPKPECM